MIPVKITAVRRADWTDLQQLYENPFAHACDVYEGQTWLSDGWNKPTGFCDSAWESIVGFVRVLGSGGGNFYDGWMKNPKSAMLSCNDGFRPVSYLIETVSECDT